MTIANKNRFPHIHALELSGGEKSAKGEEYYEEHEKELEKEFYEIMNNITERYKLGGKEKIHNGTER